MFPVLAVLMPTQKVAALRGLAPPVWGFLKRPVAARHSGTAAAPSKTRASQRRQQQQQQQQQCRTKPTKAQRPMKVIQLVRSTWDKIIDCVWPAMTRFLVVEMRKRSIANLPHATRLPVLGSCLSRANFIYFRQSITLACSARDRARARAI